MTKKKKKSPNNKRHAARRASLQMLYQWQLSQGLSLTLFEEYLAENDVSKVDVDYLQALFMGVTEHLAPLDQRLVTVLDRDIKTLDPVELALLRQAVFEFQHCVDVPYKVVINEAVELAKEFGAKDGYKYINGVLDKLAVHCRSSEV